MTTAAHNHATRWFLLSIGIAALTLPAARLHAQEDANAQPETRQTLEAVVIEVQGKVQRATTDADAKESVGWTDVTRDDHLPAGTQIKTGFRSYCILRFGADTVVKISKMTTASIDDFYKSETEQTVRLGLGYGVIRGGSAEGELRSDVVVDSTVATLAKRGTEGWQMAVEPSTAHFKISLTRSGLVEALAKLTGRSKEVRPGEYANQDNILSLWINQALFDREFKFYSDESKSDTEVSFSSKNNTGTGVLSPSSGTEAAGSSRQNNPNFVGGLTDDTQPGGDARPSFVNRPEGDFGVPDTFGDLFSGFLPFKRAHEAQRAQRTPVRRVGKARR